MSVSLLLNALFETKRQKQKVSRHLFHIRNKTTFLALFTMSKTASIKLEAAAQVDIPEWG